MRIRKLVNKRKMMIKIGLELRKMNRKIRLKVKEILLLLKESRSNINNL